MTEFRLAALLALFAAAPAAAENGTDVDIGGHLKAAVAADAFDEGSLLRELSGDGAASLSGELRVNMGYARGPWSLDAAWQALAATGDALELQQALGGTLPVTGARGTRDDRRLFDLTDVVRDRRDNAVLHRLDRLSIGFTGEHAVVRVGRQAISWGNGLVFSPLDIVNPFDPQAIDTEYKSGDDMVYAQFLLASGDDIQLAHVFRRDAATGSAAAATATTAVKYHGIAGDAEYDLMLAEHYEELTVGFGGNLALGGSVLRGDAVVTDSASGSEWQLVLNLTRSWTWGGRNVSGLVEYFHTGFGQDDGNYDVPDLASNLALTDRLQRGDAYTLGRDYLAGSLTVEMNPLWLLTPNLFVNADDGSALLQLVSNTSLGDDAVLLAALNVPLGPDGTEYGGIGSGPPGVYLSRRFGAFVQFAWYF